MVKWEIARSAVIEPAQFPSKRACGPMNKSLFALNSQDLHVKMSGSCKPLWPF